MDGKGCFKLLLMFGFGAFCSNKEIVPKINLGFCNGLMRDTDINVCCRTENTYNADVTIRYAPRDSISSPYLFRDGTPLQCTNESLHDSSGNNTANLTCVQTRGVKIYALKMEFSEFYLYGNWTCESYAGTASFIIDYVADRFEGEITKRTGERVNLTWIMTGYIDDVYVVIRPNGTHLCILQGSKTGNQLNGTGCDVKQIANNSVVVSLIFNTTFQDGGLYTCVDKTSPFVSYLILSLIEAPNLPRIIALNPETRGSGYTASKGDKTSVTIYCQTESKVSSSLSYLPQESIVWKSPPGITCEVNNPYCDVTNIDCSDYTVSIIGCEAYENTSLGLLKTGIHWKPVQDFCRIEGRIFIQSTDEDIGLIVGVLAPTVALLVLVMVLNFMIARYRRGLRPCCCTCRNPCRILSRFCRFLWRCCMCCTRRRNGQRLLNDTGGNHFQQDNQQSQSRAPRRNDTSRINTERVRRLEDAAVAAAEIGQQSFRSSSSRPDVSREARTSEIGLDAGGVISDMLTTFWQKALDIYFQGSIAFVPKYNIQRHVMGHFVTLGRIFAHSTILLQAIPIQICRSTLQLIIFGDMPLGDHSVEEFIIEDFLLYNDLRHRLVMRTALEDFDNLSDSQIQILGEIFAHFEMGIIPRKETFRQSLLQIAYNELCVKPKMVCEHISHGIPFEQKAVFWSQLTFQHIDTLYEDFKPTPQQVMQRIECLPRPPRRESLEQTCLDNLKRFISTMSQEMLLSFLQFVTAERKVPTGPIFIQFTDVRDGLARCPVAHTCNKQLELPNSYTIYEELVAEFSAILTSTEGFNFTLQ